MIIKSHGCPGPGWREIHSAFILSEGTAERVMLAPGEHLWTRAPL
jgi:hypothetical protein